MKNYSNVFNRCVYPKLLYLNIDRISIDTIFYASYSLRPQRNLSIISTVIFL